MARREDHCHRHHNQLHYASILPANNTNNNSYHDARVAARRLNEHDRTRALYVDFQDAFQDEASNDDYFGLQSVDQHQPNSNPPANLHLQSVETISEVKNTNFSPYIRYHATRETSRSSTPSDPMHFQSQYKPLPSQLLPLSHHHSSPSYVHENLHRDFTNLRMTHTMDNREQSPIPPPFTPDAMRSKLKQQESTSAASSPQHKIILPQYFLVKYLGRMPCTQIWGSKTVRTPIDDMIRSARQLTSMNEIPTLEACVSTRGLTLTHRHSPTRARHHHSRHSSPERHQHGLIPLENISYVMHDVKYSKVAACIVLRQLKSSSPDFKTNHETLTECYAFLFQSKEHAHRFALALAEGFNVQKQPISSSRPPNPEEKRDGRSPQRRSKHRSGHHHQHHDRTRYGYKYNENYPRDSHV